jgi:transposase
VRASAEPDPFDVVEPYVRQRLADDPHVWASALFDEVIALGYDRAYPTFTRHLRDRQLRPHCEPCSSSNGRAHAIIEHPPGEEIQWDWVDLPGAGWLAGGTTHLLVGALSHSSRFRGRFSDSMDQAHLIDRIHGVLERLGGTAQRWRVDRMATVIVAGTDRVQPSFVPVAKHYGVIVDPCPPRHGNRKGVVEKNIHYLTQRWWRTAEVATVEQAQASFDRFCATTADSRPREGSTGTVGELAEREPLMALPPLPFPAVIAEDRHVADNALVHWDGNSYSTPPALVGVTVTVRQRVGINSIDIVTPAGIVAAAHLLAPPGQGRVIRLPEHTQALENVVLAAFDTAKRCDRKTNRPPTPVAKAIAAEIRSAGSLREPTSPVIDLSVYQQIIDTTTNRKAQP